MQENSKITADVYISSAYADKFSLKPGDAITLKEKYENKFKAYYTYEKGKNYTFLLIKIENVDLYKNQIKIW